MISCAFTIYYFRAHKVLSVPFVEYLNFSQKMPQIFLKNTDG